MIELKLNYRDKTEAKNEHKDWKPLLTMNERSFSSLCSLAQARYIHISIQWKSIQWKSIQWIFGYIVLEPMNIMTKRIVHSLLKVVHSLAQAYSRISTLYPLTNRRPSLQSSLAILIIIVIYLLCRNTKCTYAHYRKHWWNKMYENKYYIQPTIYTTDH